MNWVKEYYHRIECGDIITSRRVKAVYKRLVNEMDDDNSPYYFDEDTGERPILFIETFCKQSQGTIGAQLKLELFQKAYIQLLFGWLEKDTGYRRFRETMFLCGRKNGKSTLLSGIALYMLIADCEGAAEIYSVATKKDQAKKVLTEAVNMVKQSPELRAVVKKRRKATFFAYFYALMNKSKNNLIEFANGKYYIMGCEVYFTGSLSKGVAYLGDFAYIVGNYSQDIAVVKSEHSGLATNSIDYLGSCVFDSKAIAALGAFVKFVKTQTT